MPQVDVDDRGQLCTEPLAHHRVDEEVDAGVENNEDRVEVLNTIPQCRDGVAPCSGAPYHSEIRTQNLKSVRI